MKKISKFMLTTLFLSSCLLVSCAKSNKNNKPTTTTPTTEDVVIPSSTNEEPKSTEVKPTISTVEIPTDVIVEDSVLNMVYVDFNKPKLDKKYNITTETIFCDLLKIDTEKQEEFVNTIDCIEMVGKEIAEEENSFLIDAANKLSSDEAYYGSPLSAIVNDFSKYVEDVKDYEESLYGDCNFEFYYFTENSSIYYIIKAQATNGSNTDLILIDSNGLQSLVSYTNDCDKLYEFTTLEKNTLKENDLETLNISKTIKFNNSGCEFSIDNFKNATSVAIPESYRTIPFEEISISLLNTCMNLEEILVPSSSSNYTSKNGVLYNKNQTELLCYPKAKQDENFTIPEGVKTINKDAFKNVKDLSLLELNSTIKSIPDKAFENSGIESIFIPETVTSIGEEIFSGCYNLSNITIPFIGSSLDNSSESDLSYFFGTTKVDGLNSEEYNDKTYYFHSINTLNIINGSINSNSFGPVEKYILSLTLPSSLKVMPKFTNLESLEKLTISNVETIGDNIFSEGYGKLKTIVGENIKTIGAGAFKDCASLETIDVTKATELGDGAFENCSSIKELYLDSALSIPDNLCKGMEGLESVGFMKATTIGASSFEGCKKLENLAFDVISTIGEYGFKDCESLKYLNFSGLTTFGTGVFQNCTSLIECNTSEDLKEVGDFAFDGCTNFKKFNGTFEPTTIGKQAFRNCILLTKISTSTVTTVGYQAFENCKSLTYISFENLTSTGRNPLVGCSSLKSFKFNFKALPVGNQVIGRFFGTTSYLNSYKATIGSFDFYIPNTLETVELCGTTYITSGSFNNCKSLKNVIISDELLSIYEGAFYNCSGLESLTVPFVGEKRYTLNSENQYTIAWLFGTKYTEGFYSVQHQYKQNSTDSSYYYGYVPTSLKKIVVTDSTYIQQYAFSGVKATSIQYTSDVTYIDQYAFSSVEFETFNISNTVTYIGALAFFKTSLKSITIPASVETIDSSAFENCYSLTTLTLTKNNALSKIAGQAFKYCDSLTTINNLESFTGEFGGYVFEYCEKLTGAVTINAKIIGTRAFYKTGFTEVTIGSSVETINDNVFNECTSLATVNINLNNAISLQLLNTSSLGYLIYNATTINITANKGSTIDDILKSGSVLRNTTKYKAEATSTNRLANFKFTKL